MDTGGSLESYRPGGLVYATENSKRPQRIENTLPRRTGSAVENPNLVPSTHVRKLTTICNSSLGDLTSFWPPMAPALICIMCFIDLARDTWLQKPLFPPRQPSQPPLQLSVILEWDGWPGPLESHVLCRLLAGVVVEGLWLLLLPQEHTQK